MGPRAVGAPLRRRPRDAPAAGDHPRHRRRARAARARHHAGRLAPQRRPRGVRRAAAHPRADRAGPARSTRRSTRCAARRSSRRTRRCRPDTTRSRSTWSRQHLAGCVGHRSATTASSSWRSGTTTTAAAAVQHDGAGAALGRRRQRRQPAARRGDARDVGADLAGAAAPSSCRSAPITNGVHVPTWMSSRDGAASSSGYLGARLARPPRRPGGLGRACSTSRTRSCGQRAQRAARSTCSRSSASARASAGPDEHVSAAARRRRRHAARPERADDRVRAALHRLQAARADLPGPRSARSHPERRAAARCRSSSPARRIRPTTPASTTCSRSTATRIDPTFGGRIAFVDDYDLHVAHFLVQGCDVWLNNPRKPLEASGTSGMKAGDQRRAAPEHRRRLVGGGLQRRERLADRRRAGRRRSGRAGRGRRRGALHAAREGGGAGLLRPRRARHPARGGCAMVQAVHRDRHAAASARAAW